MRKGDTILTVKLQVVAADGKSRPVAIRLSDIRKMLRALQSSK
jgi:hypothetical protein